MHCSILTFAAVSVPYNPQSFEINAVIFSPSSLHTQGSNVITYGKGAKKESCNEERKKNFQDLFVRMEMREKYLLVAIFSSMLV